MGYGAKKIYLTCDRTVVRGWSDYMTTHADEVSQSLAQEGVRHELWYLGEDAGGLFVIGVMDVDDAAAAARVAGSSTLSVDAVHREFKRSWDRTRVEELPIDPTREPSFAEHELLIDARPGSSLATAAGPADYQLALDALRDGVALWTHDGVLVVGNVAAGRLMSAPDGLVRPGVRREAVMAFFARRGDYGPTDDPEALARTLSDRFGTGAIETLTRTLPDGRKVQADARRLPDGRSLVTYQEVR